MARNEVKDYYKEFQFLKGTIKALRDSGAIEAVAVVSIPKRYN